MATVTILLPAPHAAQRKVLAEAKRLNCLAMGRRFGKSTLGIDRIVRPALEGFPTAWFAPGYKALLEIWRTIQDVLTPMIITRNHAEFRLEVRGGGPITMFSRDAEVSDTVGGRAFECVVVDEAALVRNLRQVSESAIRPTLADFRGEAFFLSTPRGFNNFKFFFDRGQDPERENWASWQLPTSANPFIDPEEIEAARQDMTEAAFSQEFLAAFVSWEGAVFRRVQECAIAERKDGPEMDRGNRVDYTLQRARLQALYDRWRPSRIIAEQNSIGQPIIEELQRAGLPVQPFTTANASKAAIIEGLALAFEQGSISIVNDPFCLASCRHFRLNNCLVARFDIRRRAGMKTP